jgi:oxygen-independent coproporphyrinogen-3 oxidase
MALTTLQPLRDSLHASRFPGRSLFAEPWLGKFRSLASRGLVRLRPDDGVIELTGAGEVLVEAVITTEL